jgi:hypothetical protein
MARTEDSGLLSEPVARALARGGSTKDLLVSLVGEDVGADWGRMALRAGSPEMIAAAEVTDPDPDMMRWRGRRLTRTAERSVRVAVGIAVDYGMRPMPARVLAIGLVAAPDTAASVAMGAGRGTDWASLAQLIQEDWLGTELESLDLAARWQEAGAAPSAEPGPQAGDYLVAVPAGRGGSRLGRLARLARLGRPRHRVVLAATLALLFVAAAAGALTAPGTDRPGPPPHRVMLADGAVGPEFAVRPGLSRASVPPPGWHGTGRKACAMSNQGWTHTGGGRQVLIKVLRCESFVVAANLHVNIEQSITRAATSTTRADGIPFGLLARGTEPGGAQLSYTAVVFRRGQYVVHVRAGAPRTAGSGNDRGALDVAQRQWTAVPGTPGAPLPIFDSYADTAGVVGDALSLAAAVLALLTILAALRVRARRLNARSQPPSDSADLAWIDVGDQSRRLGVQAQRRLWVFFGLWIALQSVPLSWPLLVLGYGLAARQLVLSKHFLPGTHKIWGIHSASQVKTGRRPLSTGSLVAASHATQVGALLGMAIVPIFLRLRDVGYVLPNGRFNPVVVADSGWSRPIRLVPVPLLAVGAVLLTVGVGLLWALLYRLARGRAGLDAQQTRDKDKRPPVLYLRNFADDSLTIRTSPLTRPTILEKLGVQQFERFEELIHRYLSVYGPVTKIGDQRATREPPGVAREVIRHAEWQAKVRDLIAESGLIVVGATPSASTAGLGWELDAIVEAGALDRTIFLLAPWPADSIGRRWWHFRTMAFFRVPERIDVFADRTLAVRWTDTGGWTAVHAAKRTDWAYALAMSKLAGEILDASEHDRKADERKADERRVGQPR